MAEDAPHRLRWPRVVARVIGYPLLAVVIYVLSVGPFIYVFNDRSLALNYIYGRLYSPLHWLGAQTGWLRPVMSYEQWWSTLPGGPYDRLLRKGSHLPASVDPDDAEPQP